MAQRESTLCIRFLAPVKASAARIAGILRFAEDDKAILVYYCVLMANYVF